jgi:hypothetical protein
MEAFCEHCGTPVGADQLPLTPLAVGRFVRRRRLAADDQGVPLELEVLSTRVKQRVGCRQCAETLSAVCGGVTQDGQDYGPFLHPVADRSTLIHERRFEGPSGGVFLLRLQVTPKGRFVVKGIHVPVGRRRERGTLFESSSLPESSRRLELLAVECRGRGWMPVPSVAPRRGR